MHNIDMSNDRANVAFLGSREDIWHRLGQEMKEGQTVEEWAVAAGLNWHAIKVPAIAALNGPEFDHIDPAKRFLDVENKKFIVRNDTGKVLGIGSDGYQPHQPAEVLDFFRRYVEVDDRFKLDVAGSLKGGAVIWATATFNGELSVGGDRHIARLLMSTTFDASGSTRNQGTTTRVVCNNTLDVAHYDNRAVIRTKHNTKFDAARTAKELATIARGFAEYKQLGDALAQNEMSREEVSTFFKHILDIPFDVQKDDISARKANQFEALTAAYRTTAAERNGKAGDAWAALQAVTRYVDHERNVQKGDVSVQEARFASSQFGSGNDLKGKAIQFLLPRVKDKVALAA